MGDPQTLYDKFTRKLKNNRWVVFTLIAFAVVLGIAQLLGALSSLKDTLFPAKTRVHVSAGIERYDFMAGRTEPVKSLAPIGRDIGRAQEIADELAKEIVSAVGPRQKGFEVTLQIEGHTLQASQPVPVAIVVVSSPMVQVGRISRNIGETNSLDLLPLSQDPQLLNPRGNVVEMELGALEAGLDRLPLQVFKRGNAFSFSADQDDKHKVVQFVPHKITLILESFGARGERAQNTTLSLNTALKQALGSYPFLQLSSETVADLDRRRAELQQNLHPGMGKSALANQFDVDFIVTGSVATD